MVDFFFQTPTFIIFKEIHMNQEPITNARVVINEGNIINGNINDFQIFLSNDSESIPIENRLWVQQTTNNTSVLFPQTTSTDVLYAKIYGKSGTELVIEDSVGKSQPIRILYNEVL
jgi:hypothetical protein